MPASWLDHNRDSFFKFNFIVIDFQNSIPLQNIINFSHFFMVMHPALFGNSHDVNRSGLFRFSPEMLFLFLHTGKVGKEWLKSLQLCSSLLRSYAFDKVMVSIERMEII